MRLSETAGLHVSDIHLDHEFPHVEVRPNKARMLKTSNRKRIIPLVSDSLWAAQQVIENQKATAFQDMPETVIAMAIQPVRLWANG
jgi:site-specific recombinase XerD|tara:strand:+ start:380 stop:637 length:258 start_codon:yes stop_codon:yes gene_type:complete